MKLSASFLYSGNPQYWQGHGEKDNEIVLATSFDPHTNVRQLVDGWVEDFANRMEHPDAFDGFDSDAVEKALIEAFEPDVAKQYEDENAPPVASLVKFVDTIKKACPKCDKAGKVQSDDGGESIDCDECDATGEVEDEEADYDLMAYIVVSVSDESDETAPSTK